MDFIALASEMQDEGVPHTHTHIMDERGYWHSLNDLLKRWQEASSQGRFDLQVIEALEARFEQYCHAQILRHLADSVRV
jgi:hypothetical protein